MKISNKIQLDSIDIVFWKREVKLYYEEDEGYF